MSQNDFVDQRIKIYGRSPDDELRKAKREAREPKLISKLAKTLTGIKAKIFMKKRKSEKIQLKKAIKEQVNSKKAVAVAENTTALPAFLLDREIDQKTTNELNQKIKQQRQNKTTKYSVPIAKVDGIAEREVFGVVTSGKRKKKQWKRIVNRPCFVGPDFTRKAPKYERFIRPMSQRMTHAHIVHPELHTTFKLPILSVKKNPSSDLYTSLGVLSKGTILEVNVSELGIVDGAGQIVWGKYAQITNNPERDGVINGILLL
ncbi:hypothetical protein NUSPORA_02261 [Nucleospora cyclopteri]